MSSNLMETSNINLNPLSKNEKWGQKAIPDNSKWFDLIQDRNLLDGNFEGYKLSLDPFVQYQLILKSPLDTYNFVESGEANRKMFLYQHLKLFGLQNLLIVNPFDDSNVYYFDVNSQLVKIVYNRPKIVPIRAIVPTNLELSKDRDQKVDRNNISMMFVNKSLAVINDGFDAIYICQIENQAINNENPLLAENWNVLFKWITTTHENCVSTILKDVLLLENNLHILLINVNESTNVDIKSSNTKFETLIHWLSFTNNTSDNIWSLKRRRIINCFNSVPDYTAFETDGECVYIMGPSSIRFTYDSEKPVIQFNTESNENDDESNKMLVDSSSSNALSVKEKQIEKFYSWHQTEDNISVHCRLDHLSTDGIEAKVNKNDVRIEIGFDSIKIFYKENSLISGPLFGKIKPEESVWILNSTKNLIELDLVKVNKNETWSSFLKDQDTHGEYKSILDQELSNATIEAMAQSNEKNALFTLEQQLEECDGILDYQKVDIANDEIDEKFIMFRRLDGNSHEVTHKCFVNDNKFLFEFKLNPEKCSAICLRHDVDGLVWQPYSLSSATENKWLKHEHTFLAFGYVQASKQETKYRLASPDCSYVCVIEAQRHVYLYKQSAEKLETQLKNRKTGKLIPHVAKQFLISLESSQEIFGAYCSNEFLILLLKDICYIYKINAKEK